jgi:hypothetical protein
LKGWIYKVECPEDWSNVGKGRNYQILDAPHVMEQNRNPKWECAECGLVVSGLGMEPGICWVCEFKQFLKICISKQIKWSHPVFLEN